MRSKKPYCGIYYRVSTANQDLEVQKAMLPKIAKQRKMFFQRIVKSAN